MHVIKNVNLETVCGITSKLPENTLPEVAFAGLLAGRRFRYCGKIQCGEIFSD